MKIENRGAGSIHTHPQFRGNEHMYKTIILTSVMLAFGTGLANAATVTNKDGGAIMIVVTEGGQKTEVGIAPGQSVNVCGGGCFVTMPNGDRETLSGGETVEISGGKASVK
jgi:hypothetical protein